MPVRTVYHLNIDSDMIEGATVALLPGDPGRVEALASTPPFERARELANKREYRTWIAYLGARRPSWSRRRGLAGHRPRSPSTSSRSSASNVPASRHDRRDPGGHRHWHRDRHDRGGAARRRVHSLRADRVSGRGAPRGRAGRPRGGPGARRPVPAGVSASCDTFYPGQERYDSFSGYVPRRFQGATEEWRRLHVLNYEMESSTVLTLTRRHGPARRLRGGRRRQPHPQRGRDARRPGAGRVERRARGDGGRRGLAEASLAKSTAWRAHTPGRRRCCASLELRFLGTGDAFGSGGRLQTSTLIARPSAASAGRLRALRAGGPARARARPGPIDAIVLTHLHGDHFGGVPFLLMDAHYASGRASPLVVAGPPARPPPWRARTTCFFPGTGWLAFRFPVTSSSGDGAGRRRRTVRASRRSRCAIRPTRRASGCASRWADACWRSPATRMDRALVGPLRRRGPLLWSARLRQRAAAPPRLPDAHAARARLTCRRMLLTHMGEQMLGRAAALGVRYRS